MPHYSKLSRSKALCDARSITTNPVLDFLLPAFNQRLSVRRYGAHRQYNRGPDTAISESSFFLALSYVSTCPRHRPRNGKIGGGLVGSKRAHLSTDTSRKEIQGHVARYDRTSGKSTHANGRAQKRGVPPTSTYGFFDSNEQQFAEGTRLPQSFFKDVDFIRSLVPPPRKMDRKENLSESQEMKPDPGIDEQLGLLRSMRELEEKLAKAKKNLDIALSRKHKVASDLAVSSKASLAPVVLTKDDYLDLVDLYFYSHNSRFSPESTDLSPTPLFLDDYSFTLSSDFSKGSEDGELVIEDDEEHEQASLSHVEEMLKNHQLNEIAAMQRFVDLLLSDKSSNRSLYEAYSKLPEPGVAYLPKGIVRMFLQRMSTPWTRSEKSMLRYLSLIDDMQKAKLPITVAEWSSAIYLAGRSFTKVTSSDLAQAFGVWRRMENEAGVKSHNVTFNILFDIAVRAGKFALADTILKEMHQRNLRLNRLGRVSLIYYHGLRGDGDGVRKAYRDFVEAGEIVDTVVLNCVIASLINAQEPVAAEQTYQRMKDMHTRLQKDIREDGTQVPFRKYPDPESNQLDSQMASSQLGRILARAPHLRDTLPDHHARLQDSMPLRPDHITFRTMLSYHASMSGDLDRLTVLLNDMTEVFEIPLESIVFQFLFKGFAIHGPIGGPDSSWSKKRLDLCWQTCIKAIKETQRFSYQSTYNDASFSWLPSSKEVNAMPQPTSNTALSMMQSKQRTLSAWDEFIIDLAVFPRERLKRIQRFHSQMLDDEAAAVASKSRPTTTSSPVFPYPPNDHDPFLQETRYSAPEPRFDREEGEYTLPNPASSSLVNPFSPFSTGDTFDSDGVPYPHTQQETDDAFDGDAPRHNTQSRSTTPSGHAMNVHATRPLICWLLRAYARNTGSRRQVEEIWDSVRKLWRPFDAAERDGVVRVLRRCLRDCDRVSGNM